MRVFFGSAYTKNNSVDSLRAMKRDLFDRANISNSPTILFMPPSALRSISIIHVKRKFVEIMDG